MTAPFQVIVAHSVTERTPLPLGPRCDHAVAPAALRDFLEKRRDWDRPHWREARELLAGRGCERPSYLLSFDDGYRDFLTEALPILVETRTPCLLFAVPGLATGRARPFESVLAELVARRARIRVPGGAERDTGTLASKRQVYRDLYLGLRSRPAAWRRHALARCLEANGGAPGPGEREFLDADELRLLDRHPLVTLGAHGRSHQLLTSLSRDELRDEVQGSKRDLEELLGRAVDCFAYPYGAQGRRERSAVRRAGFGYAFTTRPEPVGPRARRLTIPRIDIRRSEA